MKFSQQSEHTGNKGWGKKVVPYFLATTSLFAGGIGQAGEIPKGAVVSNDQVEKFNAYIQELAKENERINNKQAQVQKETERIIAPANSHKEKGIEISADNGKSWQSYKEWFDGNKTLLSIGSLGSLLALGAIVLRKRKEGNGNEGKKKEKDYESSFIDSLVPDSHPSGGGEDLPSNGEIKELHNSGTGEETGNIGDEERSPNIEDSGFPETKHDLHSKGFFLAKYTSSKRKISDPYHRIEYMLKEYGEGEKRNVEFLAFLFSTIDCFDLKYFEIEDKMTFVHDIIRDVYTPIIVDNYHPGSEWEAPYNWIKKMGFIENYVNAICSEVEITLNNPNITNEEIIHSISKIGSVSQTWYFTDDTTRERWTKVVKNILEKNIQLKQKIRDIPFGDLEKEGLTEDMLGILRHIEDDFGSQGHNENGTESPKVNEFPHTTPASLPGSLDGDGKEKESEIGAEINMPVTTVDLELPAEIETEPGKIFPVLTDIVETEEQKPLKLIQSFPLSKNGVRTDYRTIFDSLENKEEISISDWKILLGQLENRLENNENEENNFTLVECIIRIYVHIEDWEMAWGKLPKLQSIGFRHQDVTTQDLERWEQLIKKIRKKRNLQPDTNGKLMKKGPEDAMKFIESIPSPNPDSPLNYVTLYKELLSISSKTKTIEAFLAKLLERRESEQSNSTFHEALIRVHLNLGRIDEAAIIFHDYIREKIDYSPREYGRSLRLFSLFQEEGYVLSSSDTFDSGLIKYKTGKMLRDGKLPSYVATKEPSDSMEIMIPRLPSESFEEFIQTIHPHGIKIVPETDREDVSFNPTTDSAFDTFFDTLPGEGIENVSQESHQITRDIDFTLLRNDLDQGISFIKELLTDSAQSRLKKWSLVKDGSEDSKPMEFTDSGAFRNTRGKRDDIMRNPIDTIGGYFYQLMERYYTRLESMETILRLSPHYSIIDFYKNCASRYNKDIIQDDDMIHDLQRIEQENDIITARLKLAIIKRFIKPSRMHDGRKVSSVFLEVYKSKYSSNKAD